MRKITVGAMVSMDGVMQAPGGPAGSDRGLRVRRLGDALFRSGARRRARLRLGGGKKLFADGSAPHSFKLTRSRVSPNGLIVGHYVREGEIRIGGAAPDSPSEREIARRERMKREG